MSQENEPSQKNIEEFKKNVHQEKNLLLSQKEEAQNSEEKKTLSYMITKAEKVEDRNKPVTASPNTEKENAKIKKISFITTKEEEDIIKQKQSNIKSSMPINSFNKNKSLITNANIITNNQTKNNNNQTLKSFSKYIYI